MRRPAPTAPDRGGGLVAFALAIAAVAAAIAVGAPGSAAAGSSRNPKKDAVPPAVQWNAVALDGDLAWFARETDVVIYDVSDPERLRALDEIELDEGAEALVVREGRLYLAVGSHGLLVLDVSDPDGPRRVALQPTGGTAHDLALRLPHVYVAAGMEGLLTFDLEVPDRPRRTSREGTRGEALALDLDAEEARLALAEDQRGVRVFDLDRPDRPSEVLQIGDATGARDVLFAGGALWVARGRRGYDVWSLPERGARSRRLHRDESLPVYGLTALGAGRVALLHGGRGITGVDVETFAAAGERIELPRGFPAMRGAWDGRLLYLTCAGYGFGIVQLEGVDGPRVLYPRDRKLRIRWR